jgi:RNA polymerase sigma factor (sigma-70 family)
LYVGSSDSGPPTAKSNGCAVETQQWATGVLTSGSSYVERCFCSARQWPRFIGTFFNLTGLIKYVNHTIESFPADKELIDRILRGETRAFGIVIKNTERLVTQIVFKMIPTAEDRKDLAQDIYLKAFHKLAGFRFQSKLSTWIAQIAYNSCLSWMDKKKMVMPGNLEDEIGDPVSTEAQYNESCNTNETERWLFQKEVSIILQKEINNLPAVYQTLVMLFHHESMNYADLSLITGLPEGTVKSSLFRARKMLKENLLSKYQKEAL